MTVYICSRVYDSNPDVSPSDCVIELRGWREGPDHRLHDQYEDRAIDGGEVWTSASHLADTHGSLRRTRHVHESRESARTDGEVRRGRRRRAASVRWRQTSRGE